MSSEIGSFDEGSRLEDMYVRADYLFDSIRYKKPVGIDGIDEDRIEQCESLRELLIDIVAVRGEEVKPGTRELDKDNLPLVESVDMEHEEDIELEYDEDVSEWTNQGVRYE